MKRNPEHPLRLGRQVATAGLVLLGVVVAGAGFVLMNDRCDVACDTRVRALIQWMGYAYLVLGASAIVFAMAGRRWLSTALVFLGAVCFVVAFGQAISTVT